MEPKEIRTLIYSVGRLENLSFEENPSDEVVLLCTGKLHGPSGNVLLEISFPKTFPYRKPRYRLLNEDDQQRPSPHINRSGIVCYVEETSYVLDFSNPLGIINESLDRVASIVFDNEVDSDEFIREFNAFWQDYPEAIELLSLVESGERVSEIHFCDTSSTGIVGRSKAEICKYLDRIDIKYDPDELRWKAGAYIPLKKGAMISLPPWDQFWTKDKISQLLKENLSAWSYSKAQQILYKGLQPIIFKLPLSGSDFIHFGVYFLKEQSDVKVRPITVSRLDREFIYPRAGAKMSIHNKKVIVVGCGAIGGFITMSLCQVGIGNITLIDPDRYHSSNAHRHILGTVADYTISKVEHLKKEIEKKFLHVSVNAIPNNIEGVVARGIEVFDCADIVIVATGAPNTNFWLNKYLLDNHPSIPAIYTWVDPYGIGGHTLLTNNGQKAGCYNCLYASDPDVGPYNMASFAHKGQYFLKSQGGCAGQFVPYSTVDAQQTSLQTVRAALRVLEGTETGNSLISWKGDSTEFLANGFQLSSRYHQSADRLWMKGDQYLNRQCQSCQMNPTVSYTRDSEEEE